MSELEIFDVPQGSPQWFACRRGIITASRFSDVQASGIKGNPSKTRRSYMYDLAAEILSGELTESYSNGYMDRGKALEAEAREAYSIITGNEPELCGFMKRGDVGCSPDALIGSDGHLTIKTRLGRLHLELLESNQMPSEHAAQTQGEMWVSGRQWSDFMCYSKGLKPFIQRIPRDELYIASLSKAVAEFRAELQDLVERHRSLS